MCGLISSSDRPALVSAGAMAMPLEPRGSGSKGAAASLGRAAVEALQLAEVDPFDIAADASFGEAQSHPRLKPHQDAGLHLRMGGKVIVQTRRPGIHQLLQPFGTGSIASLEFRLADIEARPEILPNRLLAIRFRRPPERGQIIGFDTREIVLGLGVDHSEHRIGVRRALDMGDAEIVPGN